MQFDKMLHNKIKCYRNLAKKNPRRCNPSNFHIGHAPLNRKVSDIFHKVLNKI